MTHSLLQKAISKPVLFCVNSAFICKGVWIGGTYNLFYKLVCEICLILFPATLKDVKYNLYENIWSTVGGLCNFNDHVDLTRK